MFILCSRFEEGSKKDRRRIEEGSKKAMAALSKSRSRKMLSRRNRLWFDMWCRHLWGARRTPSDGGSHDAQQQDPGPPHMLLRAVPRPDYSFKPCALTRTEPDLDAFPHPARLAYPQPFWNLSSAPIHSHVRRYQMQASEFVACLQAPVLGSSGQGRRHGRRNDG
jgi:hypothetical protein